MGRALTVCVVVGDRACGGGGQSAVWWGAEWRAAGDRAEKVGDRAERVGDRAERAGDRAAGLIQSHVGVRVTDLVTE